MNKRLLEIGFIIACAAPLAVLPAAGQTASTPETKAVARAQAPDATAERAVVDKYCAVCHNAKLKTANLLLDQLDLQDVTVIGNSIGGWITAEIALLKSPRVSGIVLIDAVGIEVPGHPVADFFALTMDEVFARSFRNPERFRIDPATLPPAAQAIAAGNRAAIATYAGASMADPALAGRLPETGHSPQLETPGQVLHAIWDSADTDFSAFAR